MFFENFFPVVLKCQVGSATVEHPSGVSDSGYSLSLVFSCIIQNKWLEDLFDSRSNGYRATAVNIPQNGLIKADICIMSNCIGVGSGYMCILVSPIKTHYSSYWCMELISNVFFCLEKCWRYKNSHSSTTRASLLVHVTQHTFILLFSHECTTSLTYFQM